MTTCSLCGAEGASDYTVAPREDVIALCDICRTAAQAGPQDGPHWQCLHEAVWSEIPAVQVVAYRLLKALDTAPWAHELLDIAYLDPELLAWAEAGLSGQPEIIHRDSNGAVLASGDTVTLIKDLPVKGAGFTAKRGTAVRNISLVQDNPGQIEGRVEGQRIVILTEFVKRS
ncbi:protein PhnA [Rhodovulum bhavnagarense]|uniref:Protein PhnA n=1 Tax=Rhodovulum bhavnagarense TaxID=992286 RepID=A0A4R2RL48_9RHOB|nr:alkylphosphonate utilization protein [Rhodovulum bhavnagarense]TCP62937.1 protein PhnA [Rhodovulum bhavnagarense]